MYLSECGKIRTRKTPNMDTFHAVLVSVIINLFPIILYPVVYTWWRNSYIFRNECCKFTVEERKMYPKSTRCTASLSLKQCCAKVARAGFCMQKQSPEVFYKKTLLCNMYKQEVPSLNRHEMKFEILLRRNFLSFISVILALNRSGEHFLNTFVPNAPFSLRKGCIGKEWVKLERTRRLAFQ